MRFRGKSGPEPRGLRRGPRATRAPDRSDFRQGAPLGEFDDTAERGVGASSQSQAPEARHDARLMPARYVRPYSKGQKNDFEAVQRPTMKFVATKTADQLDLQGLHRVREWLVSRRTGIINQIRAFLLERGVAVRQGLRFLRNELPSILAAPSDALSPRMVRIIEDLAGDGRRLDERVEGCRRRSKPSRAGTRVTSG